MRCPCHADLNRIAPLPKKCRWRSCTGASLLVLISATASGASEDGSCQAALTRISGEYIACLHNAAASRLVTDALFPLDGAEQCEQDFLYRYSKVMKFWKGACPGYDEVAVNAVSQSAFDAAASNASFGADGQSAVVGQKQFEQLKSVGQEAVVTSGLVISGKSPAPQPDTILFFNNCAVDLRLMSNRPLAHGNTLTAPGTLKVALSSLSQGGDNMFHVAPVTSADQCAAVDCDGWTAIQAAGQRTGSMWESPNLTYSAYCQPTNARAGQCTADPSTTPCCGPNMTVDGTFGTLFEITPNAGGFDYIDLSTNFGTNATTPPPLCGDTGGDNCVTEYANIFFNLKTAVGRLPGCVPRGG